MANPDSSSNDGLLSRMHRYPDSGWVAGVCAGLADYSGWSVKLIRVLVILALIFSGFFPVGVIYLVLWYLMDPAEGEIGTGRRNHSAQARATASRTVGGSEARARFEKLDKRLARMEACVSQDELELRREFRNLES